MDRAQIGPIAGLLLDAEHRYFLDSRRVPGVTEIIGANGFYEFPFTSPEDLAYKKRLGDHVHRASALYDRGRLDVSSLAEETASYFNGWVAFRNDHPQIRFLAIEQMVYHPLLDFAGSLDRVFQFRPESPRAILDIKIGAELAAARLQTAAYMAGYNHAQRWHERAVNRYSVHLTNSGTYRLVPHESVFDFPAFAACRRLFEWRKSL